MNEALQALPATPFQPDQRFSDRLSPSMLSPRSKRVIIVLTVAGLVCIPFGPFGCLASGVSLVMAAILAGTQGGTQEKFWT